MSYYQYAAYGSNLHPDRLSKRVPSAKLRGTSFLPEFDLRFHKASKKDGSGKCNVLSGQIGVYVAVFDIDESEREALDKFEGLGAGYSHQLISVQEFGACSTYIADASAINDLLRPLDWYREYVIRGARFHGFPPEYVLALECVDADADTNRERSEQEWNLIKFLRSGD